MAILSKDQYLERLKKLTGDDASEETLSLIEDFTDTYADLETKSNNNAIEELQAKYDDLSKKYKERFFTTQEQKTEEKTDPIPTPEDEVNEAEEITIDDLFTEND